MRYELREGEDLWHPANICGRGNSSNEALKPCGKAGEVAGREGGAGSCGEGELIPHGPLEMGPEIVQAWTSSEWTLRI